MRGKRFLAASVYHTRDSTDVGVGERGQSCCRNRPGAPRVAAEQETEARRLSRPRRVAAAPVLGVGGRSEALAPGHVLGACGEDAPCEDPSKEHTEKQTHANHSRVENGRAGFTAAECSEKWWTAQRSALAASHAGRPVVNADALDRRHRPRHDAHGGGVDRRHGSRRARSVPARAAGFRHGARSTPAPAVLLVCSAADEGLPDPFGSPGWWGSTRQAVRGPRPLIASQKMDFARGGRSRSRDLTWGAPKRVGPKALPVAASTRLLAK